MAWDDVLFQWLVRSFLVTTPLLLLSTAVVACARQPVRRARLIELTVIGCLAGPWLAWLPFVPHWSMTTIIAHSRAQLPDVDDSRLSLRERAFVRGAKDDDGARSRAAERQSSRRDSESIAGADAQAVEALNLAAPAAEPEPRTSQPRQERFNARRWLVVAYLTGVAVMVTWWALGMIGLVRVLRSAQDADGRCCQILAEITGGANTMVKLLDSPRIEQPFTFTWRRAVIVLPSTFFEQADPRHLRWALAHEWAHVRSRDALSWCLAGLARTVFFYQPLIWWLRRQLRLAQDYLADAHAVSQAPCPEDYAEFLTACAGAHIHGVADVALGIGGRTSELYRRIVMLVEPRRPLETRCPLVWQLTTVSGVFLLVTVTATCQDVAKPPQPMHLNVRITEDRSTAQAATPDARARSRDDETEKLIQAVLARSTAIKSGVFVFAEIFDKIDLPPGLPAGEPLWRCSFSGESWAIRIPPRTYNSSSQQWANHDGRFMSLSVPEQGRNSLTIQPPGTWRSKSFEFPIHVGTIEHESTRTFLREHSDRALLTGDAKVDDIETRILELGSSAESVGSFRAG
jgi:beta-lactamase regulating signal transducer with metallopeptidase domain